MSLTFVHPFPFSSWPLHFHCFLTLQHQQHTYIWHIHTHTHTHMCTCVHTHVAVDVHPIYRGLGVAACLWLISVLINSFLEVSLVEDLIIPSNLYALWFLYMYTHRPQTHTHKEFVVNSEKGWTITKFNTIPNIPPTVTLRPSGLELRSSFLLNLFYNILNRTSI